MKKNMKTALLDIDAILWEMAPIWYKELIKINPNCPYPGTTIWEFWEGYMTKEEAHKTIDAVHFKQEHYDCFPRAHELSKALANAGYTVVIASHRNPAARGSAELWLDKHSIYYDDLYIGPNKLPLLDKTDLFIDDCPHSQVVAINKNIPVYSILYPYNKHVKGVNFYSDFETMLRGVIEFIGYFQTSKSLDWVNNNLETILL
jgi:hypothetical protein